MDREKGSVATYQKIEDAHRVLRVVENYPLTVADVEIYAQFCEKTGLHGQNLKVFLREAITAKRNRKF